MASLVPRLAAGRIFAGRYRVLGYVGQGSMGAVYRAESVDGAEVVALKVVNLAASLDGRAERRFSREIESGTRIQSPYVARTLASGKLGEGGLSWVALEWADGVGVDELVRERGALPVSLARPLLEQVFAALAAAHREGIVHRDLKPENVRARVEDGAVHVKVLDFGIAKDFGVLTLSGTTPGLGTPLWTAPEQALAGYEAVASSDVWALGLLSFFVLVGKPYWRHAGERASMADLAIELLKGEIEPASLRAKELGGPALPSGFDVWFARAVHRDPAQRFADASAAWSGLAKVLNAAAPEGGSAERRTVIVARPFSLVTLAIASCVAAGVAIYWLLRSMHI